MVDTGRDPAGQALVSDEAPAGLHPSGFDPSRKSEYFDAFERVGVGLRRLTELDPEAGAALNIAIGELRAGDIAAGRTDGMAWYADYVQRIAEIRERKSKVLAIVVQKLPEFSAYWPQERREQWFEWFFDLLEQASAIEARRAAAPESDAVEDESATSEAADAQLPVYDSDSESGALMDDKP